ncbi:hypothetical protein IQ06DRAFT_304345 [Phaeosphaeriaceae sp. SRC1lsM3a]|nr:hypothetical protein IQ06DRAFT_304345 [Stagonospora sp. SRC1lsM3a]
MAATGRLVQQLFPQAGCEYPTRFGVSFRAQQGVQCKSNPYSESFGRHKCSWTPAGCGRLNAAGFRRTFWDVLAGSIRHRSRGFENVIDSCAGETSVTTHWPSATPHHHFWSYSRDISGLSACSTQQLRTTAECAYSQRNLRNITEDQWQMLVCESNTISLPKVFRNAKTMASFTQTGSVQPVTRQGIVITCTVCSNLGGHNCHSCGGHPVHYRTNIICKDCNGQGFVGDPRLNAITSRSRTTGSNGT